MEAIAGLVGKAALSVVFQTLIGKLSSLPVIKYARRKKLESNVNSWISFLRKLKAVLDDAEERQMREAAVKMWLDDLRDLAYDVEDILDDFSTEVLRQQLTEEGEASFGKVRKLIHNYSSPLSPRKFKFNVTLGSKIQEITERLERITKEKESLKLTENAKGGSSEVVWGRFETTSLVQESQVYGREKDKETLIDKLLRNEPNGKSVSAVAIVGMGGLGKTTMAQLLYNDDEIDRSFKIKAWVFVSDEFDVFKITVKIVEGFTKQPCNLKDLNNVQEKLKEELHGKKFLLILDDMWNENYSLWVALSQPLAVGGLGSKVLITSRIEKVASTAGAVCIHRLKKLESEECLSLLALHAFGVNTFGGHPSFREIGEQIAKKCDGLPLAAKVLGGHLRGNFNREEWSEILDSNMWELPQDKCPILPALRVSYHYLPSHLKRCFAYCAIFPKDYEFHKDDLILWWMAEGYLEQSELVLSNFTKVGNKYFEDLLARSFFQPSTRDQGSKFVMHDLINDLAMWTSRNICLRLDSNGPTKSDIIFENLRHLSFVGDCYDIMERFENFSKTKGLRTFIAALNRKFWISNGALDKVISELKYLRLLCLSYYKVKKLPDSIGNLKQLRHLDMSYTKIQLLPESISNLLNLQTLKLDACQDLIELPQGMRKLTNLRILDISYTNKLKVMPPGIGHLSNLQILSKFVVGGNNGLRLEELKGLTLLRGELSIWGLEKVVDLQDARDANLKAKQDLVSLDFAWMGTSSDSEKEKQASVLDELRPHTSLKSLEISGYDGKRFSKWIGHSTFTNLETLCLLDCKSASLLPPLGGLVSLKMLKITDMHEVKRVGTELLGNTTKFEKTFPSLQTLILERMNALEEWCSSFGSGEEDRVEFPQLQNLVVSDCPMLEGKLPDQLPSLREMSISRCPSLINLECRNPSLRELVVEVCSEAALKTLANLTTLVRLKLKNIRELNYMDDGLVSMLGELQVLEIVRCRELKALVRNGKGIEGMIRLKRLTITDCDELEALVAAGETGLSYLPSLESLSITGCDKLVSFGAMRLPSSLKKMDIYGCAALECLPEGFMIDGSSTIECALEELSIKACPSLTTFPSGRLPHQLEDLLVDGCKNLESMPEFPNSIQRLIISECDHLKRLPDFPKSRVSLFIEECLNIETLPRIPNSITSITIVNVKSSAVGSLEFENSVTISADTDQSPSLESLLFDNIKEMESLPEKMIVDCSLSLRKIWIVRCVNLRRLLENSEAFHSLNHLEIRDCLNLREFPKQMVELYFLRELLVFKCPNLELLAGEHLPRDLTLLEIRGCQKVILGLFEGGLSPLTSLMYLAIDAGSGAPSIKHKKPVNLPQLQYLTIRNFKNMKSLAAAFQLPSCLTELEILECPELRELTRDGRLPSNLGCLEIFDCPLLKKRCLDRKAKYWSLISIIPRVVIDGEEILFC